MQTKSVTYVGLLGLWAGVAQAQSPMSAIDWLSETTESSIIAPFVEHPKEAAITGSASIDAITVTSLDDVSVDAVGLVPAKVAGLPRTLWGNSASADLASLTDDLGARQVPAMQDLLFSMLLAELDPPSDSDPEGTLFLARIDALMERGAVEQAEALLERAGPDDPARFQRWFDASLLTGGEDAACDAMNQAPDLAPTLPARIFCLARGGDWNAAALTLGTGRVLGQLTGAEDALLTRFLDPEIFEGAPPLPKPLRPSPLTYRMFEAIGEAIPTTTLPVAFAQADLRSNTGWKSQLEAAERLARSGALADNKLLGLYTERSPAASGGIWDRVAAIQRFDIASAAGSDEVMSTSLPNAWNAMQQVDLESVFAGLYGNKISDADLAPLAQPVAFKTVLLAPKFDENASSLVPQTDMQRFQKALAMGRPESVAAPNETARAIVDGFQMDTSSSRFKYLVSNDNLGESLLIAMAKMQDGVEGDIDKLTQAISTLRAAGFTDIAQSAALQVMILSEPK